MNTVMFPGQGSQRKGMGKDLFDIFSSETDRASEILGYDIKELCLKDPNRSLNQTQYTQPALFTVNYLQYLLDFDGKKPDYLIGHSLGEYNALLAGEAFTFEVGLQLVKKRGELMSQASGGGMAAVLGIDSTELKKILSNEGHSDVDVANYNTPSQMVIAGQGNGLKAAMKTLELRKIRVIPLNVSAPFHSRYMISAAQEFAVFINSFQFNKLKIPVIANTTGEPYNNHKLLNYLSEQIIKPVLWTESIQYLIRQGVTSYFEPRGETLTKMVDEIRKEYSPGLPGKREGAGKTLKGNTSIHKNKVAGLSSTKSQNDIEFDLALNLGSNEFRKDYGVKYSYVVGAMYRGIASKELVIRSAKASLLAFLGTGGMSIREMAVNIEIIQQELKDDEPYGMNLLHNLTDPAFEMETVKLFLQKGIKNIEAAAYVQMTAPLVYYRVKGLVRNNKNEISCNHRVLAKVSRPEVAEAFMKPAPERIVRQLLDDNLITAEQASLAKSIPMSYDICVEADSGGHTDAGVAMVLLPSIQRLRLDIHESYRYPRTIRIGLAGGIGTPQSAACSFVMGADFILTGSINQCTVEAGISDAVKDLLQDIDVQDTAYAPAGDMFEIGARVQVLKKGVLFSARANKLYSLYNMYNSLEEIPGRTIDQLETRYFKKSLTDIWNETKIYFMNKGEASEIEKAEKNPKHKMALIFRWYFAYSAKLAISGDTSNKVNFQVHTGPAMGAFNQWVKGSRFENWRNRHVDEIALKLMRETASLFRKNLQLING